MLGPAASVGFIDVLPAELFLALGLGLVKALLAIRWLLFAASVAATLVAGASLAALLLVFLREPRSRLASCPAPWIGKSRRGPPSAAETISE